MKSGITVLTAVMIAACFSSGCGRKQGPDDIVLQDPVTAVADARQMIQDKKQNPDLYKDWVPPAAIPASLRIPGMKCAVVHEDHVDLLITRIPDWAVGARIWRSNSTRKHADRPTAYAEVFFFTYSNDFPDSPENIW